MATLREQVRAAERAALERAMADAGNSAGIAARSLGVNRTYLYALLARHGLPWRRVPSRGHRGAWRLGAI